mgnify:CR=1 FL=1|tara:strand:+ start:955 stop:2571 length:1617 start_codon:yes stop_codon:yes gene_type:complete
MATEATLATGVFSVAESKALEAINKIKENGLPLFERFEELKLSDKWQELKKKKVKSDDILKKLDRKLYDSLHKNSKYLKSYRRFLNTLIQTDPNFLKKHGLDEKLEGLILDDKKGITSEYLDNLKKVADNWDNNIAFFKKNGNQFRSKLNSVGHHFISGSTLRNELIKLGFKPEDRIFRKALLNELKDRGFKIGEEVMAYIDPWSHKGKDFKGVLEELFPDQVKLGKQAFKSEKFRPLFDSAEQLFAHSTWSGGTTGSQLKPGHIFRKGAEAVKKTADHLTPFLKIPQKATEASLLLDEGIREVLKNFQAGNLKGEDQILASLGDTISKIPRPDIPGLLLDAVEEGFDLPKGRIKRVTSQFTGFDKAVQEAMLKRTFSKLGNFTTDYWSGMGMGTAFGLMFDENYKKRWQASDYLGLFNLAARDEAISQGIWHGGKALYSTLGPSLVGGTAATAISAEVLRRRSESAANAIIEERDAKTNKEKAQVLINNPFEMFTRVISPSSFPSQKPVEELKPEPDPQPSQEPVERILSPLEQEML